MRALARPSVRLLPAALALVCMTAAGCKIERVDSNQSGSAASNGSSTKGSIKTADGDNVKVGFVTNCQASFWVIAQAGCEAAAKENGVECVFRAPTSGSKAEEQSRILEEMITSKVSGVAITPIDPSNQRQVLNAAAKEMNLITQDSDAPKSNRLAYIGMSNYDAGRMCGKLVREAIPEGGRVILFVGMLGQLNADQRRQGVIDELLDRSADPDRSFDSADAVLKGEKYEIVDTRTDDTDEARAKSNAENAIAKYSDIDCMVGLFAYNPTAILEALKGADKLGEIAVVGFDEEDATLQGIQNGHCYGTIVQNPYEYGYKSVELLAKLAAGDESALPEGGFIDIPARAITQDNVDEFWAELKVLTGKDKAAESAQ